MPLIEGFNYGDTPDDLNVAPGAYEFTIKDLGPTDPDKEGRPVLLAELVVTTEGPEQEKMAWERFNFHYPVAKVRFKNLCKSAGIASDAGDIDTADLIGCTVKAEVVSNTYKDRETGVMKENTKIGKYIFDA
jgi:hypothetical protein